MPIENVLELAVRTWRTTRHRARIAFGLATSNPRDGPPEIVVRFGYALPFARWRDAELLERLRAGGSP